MNPASRLASRLDLSLRLPGEHGPLRNLIPGMAPLSATWKRNRPGEADELEVVLPGELIPWDLRILRGAVAEHWLYEHQQPSRCQPGDPGYFSGIVDNATRAPGENRVTLTCRDWTGLALGTKVPESVLADMTLSRPLPLEVLVAALLRLMPGGETWRIVSLTPLGSAPVGAPEITPAPAPPRESAAARAKRLAAAAKGPNLGQLLPAGETTVWGAVHELCVRHGVVPEVSEGADGRRVVTLVTAQDLQTSTVLRPFNRNGETVRLFVEGEAGCAVTDETIELTPSTKLPDFIDVSSTNAVTGEVLTARWPPDSLRGGDARERSAGEFQTIDGVASMAELQRKARDAFESRAHNQYRVTVTLFQPWSSGGGPSSPDMLDAAYGAGAALMRRPAPALARQLARQGVEAATAARIVEAHAAIGDFGLLFQIADVQHTWGAEQYSCAVGLRQFLGLGNFTPIARGATDINLPTNAGVA